MLEKVVVLMQVYALAEMGTYLILKHATGRWNARARSGWSKALNEVEKYPESLFKKSETGSNVCKNGRH